VEVQNLKQVAIAVQFSSSSLPHKYRRTVEI